MCMSNFGTPLTRFVAPGIPKTQVGSLSSPRSPRSRIPKLPKIPKKLPKIPRAPQDPQSPQRSPEARPAVPSAKRPHPAALPAKRCRVMVERAQVFFQRSAERAPSSEASNWATACTHPFCREAQAFGGANAAGFVSAGNARVCSCDPSVLYPPPHVRFRFLVYPSSYSSLLPSFLLLSLLPLLSILPPSLSSGALGSATLASELQIKCARPGQGHRRR